MTFTSYKSGDGIPNVPTICVEFFDSAYYGLDDGKNGHYITDIPQDSTVGYLLDMLAHMYGMQGGQFLLYKDPDDMSSRFDQDRSRHISEFGLVGDNYEPVITFMYYRGPHRRWFFDLFSGTLQHVWP